MFMPMSSTPLCSCFGSISTLYLPVCDHTTFMRYCTSSSCVLLQRLLLLRAGYSVTSSLAVAPFGAVVVIVSGSSTSSLLGLYLIYIVMFRFVKVSTFSMLSCAGALQPSGSTAVNVELCSLMQPCIYIDATNAIVPNIALLIDHIALLLLFRLIVVSVFAIAIVSVASIATISVRTRI